MISRLKWNWTGHVATRTGNHWTTRVNLLDAPWTHKELRKTKNEMEGRLE